MGEDNKYPSVKTYVLAGFDHNGIFKRRVEELSRRSDVEILRADRLSLQEAIKRIKPPANVILAAHGSEDAQFQWRKLEAYDALLKALPREGVGYIAVNSCFGGLSQNALKHLPAGTVLQTAVSNETADWSVGGFLAYPNLSFVHVMLNDLAHINTIMYKGLNDSEKKPVFAPNVLPQHIAIGGTPPRQIDTFGTIMMVRQAGENKELNQPAYDKAVNLVIEQFKLYPSNQFNQESYVRAIAKGLMEGGLPSNGEEMRVSQAIAMAYLSTTGRLQTWIDKARGGNTSLPPLEPMSPHYVYTGDSRQLKNIEGVDPKDVSALLQNTRAQLLTDPNGNLYRDTKGNPLMVDSDYFVNRTYGRSQVVPGSTTDKLIRHAVGDVAISMDEGAVETPNHVVSASVSLQSEESRGRA